MIGQDVSHAPVGDAFCLGRCGAHVALAKNRPCNWLILWGVLVEAAGIETCATATKTWPFQVLTLREAGVRLECSEAGGALLVRGCERVGDHLDVIRGDSPESSTCWNSWPTQRTLGAM